MKAVIKTSAGRGNIEYTEVKEPKIITSNEILVEVKAAGICGTDISLYDWADAIVREYNPSIPLIMGHEFAGEIVELGKDVSEFAMGDRITANPGISCGKC